MPSRDELVAKFREEARNPDSAVAAYTAGRLTIEGERASYTGWVNGNGGLGLGLNTDSGRFLLFCLASAWSASGRWENAATTIMAMKTADKGFCAMAENWQNDPAEAERRTRKAHQQFCNTFRAHRGVTGVFRADYFPAFANIANNWNEISGLMNKAGAAENGTESWESFAVYLRGIPGLAPGGRRLLIKIPLILRELRCQKVFKNIPGKYCCIPDARVLDAIRWLQAQGENDFRGMSVNRPGDIGSLLRQSAAIFGLFGDLYDLPLFAVEDLYAIP